MLTPISPIPTALIQSLRLRQNYRQRMSSNKRFLSPNHLPSPCLPFIPEIHHRPLSLSTCLAYYVAQSSLQMLRISVPSDHLHEDHYRPIRRFRPENPHRMLGCLPRSMLRHHCSQSPGIGSAQGQACPLPSGTHRVKHGKQTLALSLHKGPVQESMSASLWNEIFYPQTKIWKNSFLLR